ncbi:cupin domain-containing protein [Balneola sp. MJW-20]|uniref:cupin domain-containing protein n=1 Tax=Gracilimonas aurantiaca TaxID=3234185 RepID=UPI003467EC34
MSPKKVNIDEKLSLFSDHWNPRIVGELNGQMVKLAKIKGTFDWHKHENEDELFYCLAGSFDLEFRDKTLHVKEREFVIVPKGVEHRPVAKEEASILLFEPATTLNTGNVKNDRTKSDLERI